MQPWSLWLGLQCLVPLVVGGRTGVRTARRAGPGIVPGRIAGRIAKYTFDRFKADFGRDYSHDEEEHSRRAAIFESRLEDIQAHNAKRSSWRKEVNHLSDWTEDELRGLMGYRPPPRPHNGGTSFMQRSAESSCMGANSMCIQEGASCCPGFICGFTGLCEKIQTADAVDYTRDMPTAHDILDQGACGSCWAVAATATLEAHAALYAKQRNLVFTRQLSPQALLSCTKNPHKCGGTGGCGGATAELAFESLRVGDGNLRLGVLPLDLQEYTAKDDCAALSLSSLESPPAVHIGGWKKIPENDPKAMMDALANVGPVVASIAANGLQSYGSGIISGKDVNDFVLNHAVVMMGYGYDEALGMNYWNIRNSWSSSWGERGYFRLERYAPFGEEPSGVDKAPGEGVACQDKNGNYPAQATYSGVLGILGDTAHPVNITVDARLMERASAFRNRPNGATLAGGGAVGDIEWCRGQCQRFAMGALEHKFGLDFGRHPAACLAACAEAAELGLLAMRS